MSTKTVRPYGLWPSPISPRSLSRQLRLEAARWDSDGQTLVWLEGRSGHGVLVADATGSDAPRDLTAEHNVRAEVGYGGGDFAVHGGHVFFVEHKTGRIYRQALSGGDARPITPSFGKASSPAISPDGRWVMYVHHDGADQDCLAVVDAEGHQWPQILARGRDFYMQPRWSPDGRQVAWISWDHPNMPWDGSWLELARVAAGAGEAPRLEQPQVIAGGPDIAIFQPEFSPDGKRMLFVSDETGWGRIACKELPDGKQQWLTPSGAEFGTPAWLQDQRTFAVAPDGRRLFAISSSGGLHQVVEIDLESAQLREVEELSEYREVSQIATSHGSDWLCFIGSSAKIPPRVVCYDWSTRRLRIARRASGETVPLEKLGGCQAISWSTADGETSHGLYYVPASDEFEGSGKPPLIVVIHGGPTSQARAGWRPDAQFFATRGYAVLLVNYRGSTGYGREYMLRLRGSWGVCDVQDAVSGARHLAETGMIDGQRTVIMGGSAGGFTVLQTMVEHPDAFAAGISLYGVADQFRLAASTHKFESRYLDSMLGPLPEAAPIYRARSPLLRAERIRRPMAIFQGDIDRVVPREQSEQIARALKRNGTPHVYHVYQGEGHGWRKQQTIEHFYAAVEQFLRDHIIYK